MAWMEHGLQISLKRDALSVEDKTAAGASGCARNYGRQCINLHSANLSKRKPMESEVSEEFIVDQP